jgi:hypothetical protein
VLCVEYQTWGLAETLQVNEIFVSQVAKLWLFLVYRHNFTSEPLRAAFTKNAHAYSAYDLNT